MLTILDAIEDPALFGPWFTPTAPWRAWLVFLAALFGLPLSEADQILYHHTAPWLPLSTRSTDQQSPGGGQRVSREACCVKASSVGPAFPHNPVAR